MSARGRCITNSRVQKFLKRSVNKLHYILDGVNIIGLSYEEELFLKTLAQSRTKYPCNIDWAALIWYVLAIEEIF